MSVSTVLLPVLLALVPDDPTSTLTITLSPPEPLAEIRLVLGEALEPPIVLSPHSSFDAFDRRFEPIDLIALGPSGEAISLERTAANRWTSAAPLAELRHRVRLDRRALPIVQERNDQYACSYVEDDHAMLFTSELLLLPESLEAEHVAVRFDLPDEWPLFTPWSTGPDETFRAPSRASLENDIVAAGHWHSATVELPGFTGTFVTAPGQDALAELCRTAFSQILESEIELFGRVPLPRYLFVFGRADVSGLGGSPRTRSMTVFCHPSLLPRMSASLQRMIAHELHHVWVMQTVQARDDLRWLNEGFTEYFAWLVCARLGLMSWQDLADGVGAKAAAVLDNPVRGELALQEAGGPRFFTDPNAARLTYDGGFLLAAWLDRWLRTHHRRSLDELMRWLVNRGEEPRRLDTEDFLEELGSFADEDVARRLRELTEGPLEFDPVPELEALGARLEEHLEPRPLDPGFALDGVRITALGTGALAGMLGLRIGDVLLEVNGREVTSEADVREAWASPQDGRIVVAYERKGEPGTIDVPRPHHHRFDVALEPWPEHAREPTESERSRRHP